MKRCDLHTHSICSDGTMTPSELVELAKDSGLSALALTDHDTIRGLAELTAAGQRAGIETVGGCEFSTEYEGGELHLLGLFLRPEAFGQIETLLEERHAAKLRSNKAMIERLRARGYDVTYEQALALSDAEEINRSHIARLMMRKGYVGSVKEAFQTVLHERGGIYEPARRPNVLRIIRFLKQIGAVTVLAHPFLNLTGEELLAFLPKAKEAGLDGMETHYTTFDDAMTACASKIAADFGLLESGGSDFHGEAKPDIRLGSGRGTLCVPYAFYQNLAARAGISTKTETV